MAQKTLDSFVISPKKAKRPASQDAATASPKRARTEGVETVAVTPEQADDGNGEQGKQTSVIADKTGAVEQLDLSFLGSFGSELLGQLRSADWRLNLMPEFRKPYFHELMKFLDGEMKTQTIFPAREDIFNAYNLCALKDIKVLLLGQDPYHGLGQAHGLCFSVKESVQFPPSLRNIFAELKTDIPGFVVPAHGSLDGWTRQGVMLLNAVLTVRKASANSHQGKGWEQLTDATIRVISQKCENVVFLLWGAYAQKKASLIDASKHLVIKSVHPSPLSASKGWFGSKCFSKANTFLQAKGRETIDWKLPKSD